MKSLMRSSTPFALLLVALVASSCGSCGEDGQPLSYECDGNLQTNTIDASEWVRNNTEIQRYYYESDPEADVVALELLDSSDATLGTLTIEGFFGRPSDPPEDGEEANENHQVEASFVGEDGGEALDLTTDAFLVNEHIDEFRTRTLLQRGDAEVVVRSDFKALDCYANEEPEEGAGHPCAWPAPVFEPEFAVPTCGYDVNPDFPQAPNLNDVEYRAAVDFDPGMGGYLQATGQTYATFEPVQGSDVATDREEVADWLETTGADAIIGTDAERLASAAYVDPAWMDHVENHAATCLQQQFEQSESELQTVRQPAHPHEGFGCGSDDSEMLMSTDDVETIRQAGGGSSCEECADGCGKPHLRTYAGSSYPFHAAGEFTLAKASVGDPFEIQVRTVPAGDLSCRDNIEACQQVTVISAIAMQIGEVRIGLYHGRTPHLVVNGDAVDRVSEADLSGLPEGANIHQHGDREFRFDWPGGEALEAAVGEYYLDVHGILPVERFGQVSGLWGNYTNISSDDYKTRSGEVLEKPLDFDTFYDEFVDSWRIDTENSLFDYEDGNSTEDFTIPELPTEAYSVDDLPEDLRAAAEEACSSVTGHPDKNWCIFDVVCMCDDAVAESTEDLGPHEAITDLAGDPPITVTGDLCLEEPQTLEHQPAGEPTCPPQNEPCIHVIREQTGVELADDLAVDATEPGTYSSEDELGNSAIPAGTAVDSYLIHLNEVPDETGSLLGDVLFSTQILGVITSDESLQTGDGRLGNPDYTFEEPPRGPNFEADRLQLTDNQSKLRMVFHPRNRPTEIRVVTAAD